VTQEKPIDDLEDDAPDVKNDPVDDAAPIPPEAVAVPSENDDDTPEKLP
jgi:hypothetical protein